VKQGWVIKDNSFDDAARRVQPLDFPLQLAVSSECKGSAAVPMMRVVDRLRGNLLGNLVSDPRRRLQGSEGISGGPVLRKRKELLVDCKAPFVTACIQFRQVRPNS